MRESLETYFISVFEQEFNYNLALEILLYASNKQRKKMHKAFFLGFIKNNSKSQSAIAQFTLKIQYYTPRRKKYDIIGFIKFLK